MIIEIFYRIELSEEDFNDIIRAFGLAAKKCRDQNLETDAIKFDNLKSIYEDKVNL